DGDGAQRLDVEVPLVVGGAGGGALGDEFEEVALAGVGPGGVRGGGHAAPCQFFPATRSAMSASCSAVNACPSAASHSRRAEVRLSRRSTKIARSLMPTPASASAGSRCTR